MINILIVIIMGLAIAGAATFAAVAFMTVSQSANDAYLNLIRLEESAAAIQAHFLYLDGAVRAPSGTNGADYMQVPSWITHNARTLSGIPFLYCPYATNAVAGSAATVTLPGVTDYAIETVSSDATGNHDYVMTSAAPPADAPGGTLALLVMPAPNTRTMPDCNDVTAVDGALLVTGGVVIPVAARDLSLRYVSATPGYVQIYAAPAAAGSESGRDAANPVTLDTAMQLWRDFQPRAAIINLASGTYTVTAATLDATAIDAGNPKDLRLVWRGGTGATATTILDAGTEDAVMTAQWFLENLTYASTGDIAVGKGSALNLSNADLTIDTISAAGDVTVYETSTITGAFAAKNGVSGGHLNVLGPLTVRASLYGIQDVEVAVSSTLAIDSGIRVPLLQVANGAVNLITTTGAALEGGRVEIVNGSTVTIGPDSGTLVAGATMNAGALYIDASSLVFSGTVTNGVSLTAGAELFLTGGAAIGANNAALRPDKGVITDAAAPYGARIGGSTATGAQATVYANNLCWSSGAVTDVFTDSDEGNNLTSAARGNSAPTDYRYLVIDNNSDWLCRR